MKWIRKIIRVLEALLYVLCHIFIFFVITCVAIFLTKIFIEDYMVRRYFVGIAIIIAIALSVIYISNYNKKYKSNDSNTPQGQNDLFSDKDIFRMGERNVDRRNLVK